MPYPFHLILNLLEAIVNLCGEWNVKSQAALAGGNVFQLDWLKWIRPTPVSRHVTLSFEAGFEDYSNSLLLLEIEFKPEKKFLIPSRIRL